VPELPDLIVFERRLRDTVLDRTIREVAVREPSLLEDVTAEELAERVEGSAEQESRRHGKWLFARLSTGGWIRFHFGMTGVFHPFDGAHAPDDAHVLFRLEEGGGLAWSCPRKLGHVGWTEDPDEFAAEKGLGPDPLREGFGVQDFLAALEGRRGMVKSTLMNQEVLAGLGNESTDEILFQLRIHPRTSLPELDEEGRRRLWETTRHVLHTAAEAEGDPERMPEGWLLRARALGEEERCPRCSTAIERVKVSGRNARICPECQPAP